jgi:hypothetical protein
MKLIITESQSKNLAYRWISSKYSNLILNNEDPFIDVYVKPSGDFVFEYIVKSGEVSVSRSNIIYNLTYIFDLDYGDMLDVIRKWLKEQYNINARSVTFFDDITNEDDE